MLKIKPTQQSALVMSIIKQVYNKIYLSTPRTTATTPRSKLIDHTLVAGGCIRDLIFNKPVTDIDIFVFNNPESIFSYLLTELENGMPFNSIKRLSTEYTDTDVKTVYQIDDYALPVQIIFEKRKDMTPNELLSSFPTSVSRCAWSPKHNKLIASHMFNIVCRQKIIYYKDDKKLYPYYQKLNKKFPASEFNWIKT